MKFYHNKEDGSYAILLDNGALSKTDLAIVKEDERGLFSEIPEKEVPVCLRKGLQEICSLRNKRISLSNEERELLEKKETLNCKIQAIELQLVENRVARQNCYNMCLDISRATSAEMSKIEYRKTVKGDEIMKMSFYDDSLNRALAEVIFEKTKRPLIYTHGYEYRHPTTCRKPIGIEDAMRILKDNSYLDISFEEECIHLNTFSSNDMY